jgi:hypothetical protein
MRFPLSVFLHYPSVYQLIPYIELKYGSELSEILFLSTFMLLPRSSNAYTYIHTVQLST